MTEHYTVEFAHTPKRHAMDGYVYGEANAIGRVRAADRGYDRPVVDPDLSWPDGIMPGPDGALYVVATQLHLSPVLAAPGAAPKLPFKVFRFDPKGAGK